MNLVTLVTFAASIPQRGHNDELRTINKVTDETAYLGAVKAITLYGAYVKYRTRLQYPLTKELQKLKTLRRSMGK
jgi:hypothetical protein